MSTITNLVFDIETIPETLDDRIYARLFNKKSFHSARSFNPLLNRIVALGYKALDEDGNPIAETNVLTGSEEHIVSFFATNVLDGLRVRLVGFNSHSFDFPNVLFKFALYNCFPDFLPRSGKYSTREHADLRGILTGFDQFQIGTLADYCIRFGIELPEDAGDGSDVEQWFSQGEIDKIIYHCKSDVEATAKLFKRLLPIVKSLE